MCVTSFFPLRVPADVLHVTKNNRGVPSFFSCGIIHMWANKLHTEYMAEFSRQVPTVVWMSQLLLHQWHHKQLCLGYSCLSLSTTIPGTYVHQATFNTICKAHPFWNGKLSSWQTHSVPNFANYMPLGIMMLYSLKYNITSDQTQLPQYSVLSVG